MSDARTTDQSAATISRRRFMQQAATAAAFTIVPRHVLGGRAYAAPSEKLNIAGVGIGGVGRSFLQGCAPGAKRHASPSCATWTTSTPSLSSRSTRRPSATATIARCSTRKTRTSTRSWWRRRTIRMP